VSLPHPFDGVAGPIAPDFRHLVEPAYERAMLDELRSILAGIPHDRLAIQWDLCHVVWLWEGWLKPSPTMGDVHAELIDRVVRVSRAVPEDVELGYHLCYGDHFHRHLQEPTDTANVTEIANRVSAQVTRPIQWVHLPVPIERDDEAYLQPLTGLRLHPETKLFLGLVHFRDGAAGTQHRAHVAQQIVGREFGVATECGMGRRPPERGGAPDTFRHLLEIHAQVAQPIA
jgi:hypothetical protein